MPEYWLFALGALFVLVTLFLPKGILGVLDQLRAAKKPVPPSENPVEAEDRLPAVAE